MKKKLNFIISLLLVTALALGVFVMPAASYENDVKTSSSAMLLINLDTDTVCYAVEPDRKRYASYQAELMTFITASEQEDAPEERKVKVEEAFIDALPYSDGSLDRFTGRTLTLKDLMAIMLLTSGNDAAYLIADTLSGGDVERFVEQMNEKAAQLGCDRTQFVTPGYSESDQHYTTCRDIYKMYKGLYRNKLYQEIITAPTYLPSGFENADEKTARKYTVTTQNSLINPDSPFYFRYTTGGKFSYDPVAKANYMVTTTYHNMSYIFVAMHGKTESEENVFADGRHLVVWAYLNLSDRKVSDSDNSITSYRIAADWGEYNSSLAASNSSYKTLPNEFDPKKLSYDLHIPERTALPVFAGQSIGTAGIYYDGGQIDNVSLIADKSEGVSLLGDLSGFAEAALTDILSEDPSSDTPAAVPVTATEEQQTVDAEDLK